MLTDVSSVLSDLITFSDAADQIILDTNLGNDQVNEWFSHIKETANAIVEGTYCRASTSTEQPSRFTAEDLPSLVTLLKGKQNSHRVSTLLAEVQKDNRVRLSHRKSRKSLRKIVLGKGRSNQWHISNRKSSVKEIEIIQEDETTTPIPKDKLLEGGLNVSVSKKHHNKSYFSELNTSSNVTSGSGAVLCTPINNKEFSSNTGEKTHSKFKITNVEKKNVTFSSQNSTLSEFKTPVESDLKSHGKESSVIKISNSSVSPENEDGEFVTPPNKTITIISDSSSDKSKLETPVTRSKRKSSIQHSQENAKRVKNITSEIRSSKRNREKRVDNFTGNNVFKAINSSKVINSVIPAKNLSQQNQTRPEKRILREIQKKEEKVSQNAKKIQSLQKIKIEENKKARERKMEKALQQRKKIEMEKEERIRSRTQSRQENVQQMEPTTKKGAVRKVEVSAVRSSGKPLRSPVKKIKTSNDEQKPSKYDKNVLEVNKICMQEPSKEIANTNYLNNLNSTYVRSPANVETNEIAPSSNEKAPPKPLRNVKKPNSSNKNTSDFETVKGNDKGLPSALSSNSTCTVTPALTSTPATKKVESKVNIAKTPVSNNAKKPNSYAMTPHEASFVSYDISEIKSDDSDDDEPSGHKPIPAWASGVNMKTALLKQFYAPIDIDEIFGNVMPPPKLQDIMGMEKKHYHKRTSSAIWLESPNRSRIIGT